MPNRLLHDHIGSSTKIGSWSVSTLDANGPGVDGKWTHVTPWRSGPVAVDGVPRTLALYAWAPVGPLAVIGSGYLLDGRPTGGLAVLSGGPFPVQWDFAVPPIDGAAGPVTIKMGTEGWGTWSAAVDPAELELADIPPAADGPPWIWIAAAGALLVFVLAPKGGSRG
jgi:hypothetical protein